MIDDDRRVRKREVFNWDFALMGNNPKIKWWVEELESPLPIFEMNEQETRHDKNCEDCKFKRTVEEILNIMAIHDFVRKKFEKESDSGKGYRIEVK